MKSWPRGATASGGTVLRWALQSRFSCRACVELRVLDFGDGLHATNGNGAFLLRLVP